MKNLYKIRHIGLIFVLILIIPLLTLGAEFRVGEQPSFGPSESVSDDLYMTGGNVTSAGAVQGDLVAGGGSVLISGAVRGDVLAFGGTVTVVGEVSDDVRAGGGTIILQGVVRGDVVLGGGQVSLAGERIGGDLTVGGGTVNIVSAIAGDAKIGGGSVYINSDIGGDVDIIADEVTLGPRANIAGDFTYNAPKEATIEEGAIVRGETTFTMHEGRPVKNFGPWIAGMFSLWTLGKFLMLFAGALILSRIFTRYSKEIVHRAVKEPLKEFGRGIVFVIVLPVFSVLLLITVVGIPLGMIGLLLFPIIMIFASFLATLLLGSILHKWIWKTATYEMNWKIVLLGAFAISLLSLVPLVGWIVRCVIMLMALGAALSIKWEVMKTWR